MHDLPHFISYSLLLSCRLEFKQILYKSLKISSIFDCFKYACALSKKIIFGGFHGLLSTQSLSVDTFCKTLRYSGPGLFTYKKEAFAIHIGSVGFPPGDIRHAMFKLRILFLFILCRHFMCLMQMECADRINPVCITQKLVTASGMRDFYCLSETF